MENQFSYLNKPVSPPLKFFGLTGRCDREQFLKILEYVENELGCRVFYRCQSDEYLKIVKADSGTPVPPAKVKERKSK